MFISVLVLFTLLSTSPPQALSACAGRLQPNACSAYAQTLRRGLRSDDAVVNSVLRWACTRGESASCVDLVAVEQKSYDKAQQNKAKACVLTTERSFSTLTQHFSYQCFVVGTNSLNGAREVACKKGDERSCDAAGMPMPEAGVRSAAVDGHQRSNDNPDAPIPTPYNFGESTHGLSLTDLFGVMSVEGSVRTDKGAQVEGAKVTISSVPYNWDDPGARTATTTADGRFAFEGVPREQTYLVASAPGAYPVGVSLGDVNGEKTVRAHLRLPESAPTKMTGTVLDESNAPVSGAQVELWYHPGGPLLAHRTTTDKDGSYVFEGPPTSFRTTILARHPDGRLGWSTNDPPARTDHSVRLAPKGANATLLFVSDTGKPQPGVPVVFKLSNLAQLSDEHGQVVAPQSMRSDRDTYIVQMTPLSLKEAPRNSNNQIVIPTGRMLIPYKAEAVKVTRARPDAKGKLPASPARNDEPPSGARSQGTSEFTVITGLPAGTYDVVARDWRSESMAKTTVTLTPGQDVKVPIRLAARETLVKVVDGAGRRPIAGAVVTLGSVVRSTGLDGTVRLRWPDDGSRYASVRLELRGFVPRAAVLDLDLKAQTVVLWPDEVFSPKQELRYPWAYWPGFDVEETGAGVWEVTSIHPDGPCVTLLKSGDTLVRINNQPPTLKNKEVLYGMLLSDLPSRLVISRGGRSMPVTLPPPPNVVFDGAYP